MAEGKIPSADEVRGILKGNEAWSAQDVIDAMRFVRIAQKDPVALDDIMDMLLDCAPETDGDKGIQRVLELISDGSLKVAMTDV